MKRALSGAIVPSMRQRRRRPRGHIRELPSGSFQAIAYAGTDPLTGKLRYERVTVKTYQAAEVALTRLQNQIDEDRHPKSDLTVRQAIEQDGRCRLAPHPATRPPATSAVLPLSGPVLGGRGRAR